jgi:O-antigen ligase
VFLHNPLLGVGYVAFSTVSGDYGELRLIGAPAENYLLETASGMGVPGVIALLVVLVRLFQLGAAVRREAPVGSLGHAIARYHTPLVIGLLVVSLTGDNFCSMVALGQLALWCAMLVRAGHLSLERASA